MTVAIIGPVFQGVVLILLVLGIVLYMLGTDGSKPHSK